MSTLKFKLSIIKFSKESKITLILFFLAEQLFQNKAQYSNNHDQYFFKCPKKLPLPTPNSKIDKLGFNLFMKSILLLSLKSKLVSFLKG